MHVDTSAGTVDLAAPPPGARSAGLDPNAIGGGTLITGLAAAPDGDLLLARRNVPYLMRFDAMLDQLSPISFSAAADAQAIAVTTDGTIFLALAGDPGHIVAYDLQRTSRSTLPGDAGTLTAVGERVLTGFGANDPTWPSIGAAPAAATGVPVGSDPIAPDPRGGLTVVAGPRILHDDGGMIVGEIDIPTAATTSVEGQAIPAVPLFQPTAVVTDVHGVSWLVAGSLLVRVRT